MTSLTTGRRTASAVVPSVAFATAVSGVIARVRGARAAVAPVVLWAPALVGVLWTTVGGGHLPLDR